jgi:protein involved in polysaccharide export with SLBB domain
MQLKSEIKKEENENVEEMEEIFDEVVIEPDKIYTKYDFENNYGYDYFQREINFFDNVPAPKDYLLGPGDYISISIWGEANLIKDFTINKDGLIFFENIGFINLSNKNINEAENHLLVVLQKIYSTLSKEKNTSKLMIELKKAKSLNIYFSGEVFNPGIHVVHPFADVFAALTQAGGVKITGSLRNIELIRNNIMIKKVDFYSFFNKGESDFSDFKLIDGDVLFVPPVNRRVEIEGAISRPGKYELHKEDSLNDLINYAAGLTADASSIAVIDRIIPIKERKNDDYVFDSENINFVFNQVANFNNGDIIQINTLGKISSKTRIYGRVKNPGEYSAKNSTLKDILDLAGGFKDPIYRKTINDKEIIILRKDESQFYGKEIISSYENSSNININIDDKIFVYESKNYSNSFTYRVEGEVNKPGTYVLTKGLKLREAIDIAGGLTSLATLNNISVSQEFTVVDSTGQSLTETEDVNNIDLDFELGINSVINVLPFENVIKVEGAVYNPGLIAFKKGLTLNQAIILAGGYMPYSLKNQTYIRSANGQIKKSKAFSFRSRRISPGDTIVVPLDLNPSEFNATSFFANLSSTLANIAAIVVIIQNNS